MAQSFSAALYGEVSTFDALNGGYQLIGNGYNGPVYKSFPNEGIAITGISPAQVFGTKFGTVTANSIIEIIPPALQPIGFSKKYLCDATEAALNTLRNS